MDDVLKFLESEIQSFENMLGEFNHKRSLKTQGKPTLKPKPDHFMKTEKPKILPKPKFVAGQTVKFKPRKTQFGTEV